VLGVSNNAGGLNIQNLNYLQMTGDIDGVVPTVLYIKNTNDIEMIAQRNLLFTSVIGDMAVNVPAGVVFNTNTITNNLNTGSIQNNNIGSCVYDFVGGLSQLTMSNLGLSATNDMDLINFRDLYLTGASIQMPNGNDLKISSNANANYLSIFPTSLTTIIETNNDMLINTSTGNMSLTPFGGFTLSVGTDITLNGASITSPTSSGNAPLHLVLTINGSPYKIQLLNP